MYKTTKSSLRKTSPNVTNHTASSRAMPLCQHTARRADTSKHKHARQTRAEHIPHYQQHLNSWQQAGLWSKEWQHQAIQLTGNPTAARIRVPSPPQTNNKLAIPASKAASASLPALCLKAAGRSLGSLHPGLGASLGGVTENFITPAPA